MNKYFDGVNKNAETDQAKTQEATLSDWTYQKYKEATIAKEKYVKEWRKFIDAYNGDYFKNTSRPEYKSNEISNMIYALVESMRPIMADEEVTFDVLPRKQEGLEKADLVNKALTYEFDREQMRYKILQSLVPCLQLGTSIFYLGWNADKGANGEVDCKIINPFNFFPDPLAQDIDSCEFCIYATYKHVNQLKKMYPKLANKFVGSSVKYPELVANREQEDVKTDTQVLVLETWCRDYTYIDVEEEVNGEIVKVKKRQFPNGRVIVTAPELQLVLEDKENPYNDGKFPFVLHKDIDVPFEFWGKGEIEQLISPQQYANELTNQIIDNAKHTANMQWILDKNSGIGQGVLTNRPGLVVRKNPGTEVRRDTPPSMPVYVREQIEILKTDMEQISGVHEVMQGKNNSNVTAGTAILALQEASQSRIRLKIKVMECALQRLAIMWYSRIQQFWLQDRYIRVVKSPENQNPNLMQTDTANGLPIKDRFEFFKVNRKDFQDDYDIKIVANATMAKNKSALLDMFIRLAQTMAEDGLPMIDRETLLSYVPVPNRNEILAKFEQIKQQQQDAQIQQAQEAVQQIQQELATQMQQTQEAVKQIIQTVQELNKEVNKIENEHEALKEQEIKREIENNGYQRGVNDLRVKFMDAMAQAQQEQSDLLSYGEGSSLEGLTDGDVPIGDDVQGADQIPDSLLTSLDKLSPVELQAFLSNYPELTNAIKNGGATQM